MPLGKSEVSQLADLARLQLDNSQISKMSSHLETVAAWFRELDDVDLSGESIKPTASHGDDNLRQDTVQPSLSQPEALGNAPDQDGKLFRVPGVMKQ